MANKSGGMLMNSKGGIYTTLAAVLVIAVMSASMMQVLAVQDDVGVKIAGSAARDVKLAWVNARYLADKAVSKSLYMQIDTGTCTAPAGGFNSIVVQGHIMTALGNLETANCYVLNVINLPLSTAYIMDLKCESPDERVSFMDAVDVQKTVNLSMVDNDGDGTSDACQIKITDYISGADDIYVVV